MVPLRGVSHVISIKSFQSPYTAMRAIVSHPHTPSALHPIHPSLLGSLRRTTMVTPFTIINVLLITTLITACADIDEHTGHLAQEHDVELTEMESELRRRRPTPLRGQVNRSNQRRGQPAPPRPVFELSKLRESSTLKLLPADTI